MVPWAQIHDLLNYIKTQKARDHVLDKRELQQLAEDHGGLKKGRSLFFPHDESFALRFSKANKTSFPGTVLSLRKIRKYESIPLIVCAVRPRRVSFHLMNSTFVIKVSHSSHSLTIANVRGSINGSDILTEFDGLTNQAQHFEELFARHLSVGWQSNLERIVTNTTAIEGTGTLFQPTSVQRKQILAAPNLAATIVGTADYLALQADLRRRLTAERERILQLAQSQNVNLRGNRIEKVITGEKSSHDLADLVWQVGGVAFHIDIKTKLVGRSSNPKAYNIDKMLKLLGDGHLLGLYFVAIDVASQRLTSKLLTIFDRRILETTRVQHHWAGRNSRGVAQLSGNFASAIREGYEESIPIPEARRFLNRLLADSE